MPLITCGLSLCIQGTRCTKDLPPELARFIPVYTGNTNVIELYWWLETVYPCVYREHKFCEYFIS